MTGGGGGLLAPPHSGSSGSVHITEKYGRTPVITGFAPRTRGRISPHTAHQTSSHGGIAKFLVDDSSSKSAQPPSGPPRILIPDVPPCPQTVRRLLTADRGAVKIHRHERRKSFVTRRLVRTDSSIRQCRFEGHAGVFPGSGSFQKPSEHGDSIPLRQIWRDSQDAGVASPSNRPVAEEPHPPQKTAGLLRANEVRPPPLR